GNTIFAVKFSICNIFDKMLNIYKISSFTCSLDIIVPHSCSKAGPRPTVKNGGNRLGIGSPE
ncbi:MAG: hypothetical protein PHS73_04640, partial [Candidatus Peribacteraceae bacterium]|nr:hypothetical protein [Candidatus Peribacteraceae bacterium]